MKGYCPSCGKETDEVDFVQYNGVCEDCSEKDDRVIYRIYPSGYKRNHSYNLQRLFNIDPNGVDYYNPNNVAIEFKETFAISDKSHWFKVPKKQVEASDLFVFCFKRERYWVVDKEDIKGAYKFNTYHTRANIRLGKVKAMSFFETSNILELKEFLDQLNL